MDMTKTNGKDESLWLKVFCPESMCFRVEEGGIDLSASGRPESDAHAGASKDLFEGIFCPEDSCEVYQNSDLP
jgi:hypothetical protein